MKILIIKYGSEYMVADERGCVSRPAIGMRASSDWKIIGVERLSNRGFTCERFTLGDLFNGSIQWKYKNGKQRVHVLDVDHGTYRAWGSPSHEVNVLEGAAAREYLARVWRSGVMG